jgi:SAM-dependent methyltransferase
MSSSSTRRRLLTLVALSTVAIHAAAQTPVTKPFAPVSGQPGKDVIWVPTAQALVEKMLDLAGVTSTDYVVDLGSGDGRTVIAAAKRGARALGIEYNPDMVSLSQRNAADEGVSNTATFVKTDLFEADFSQATVVTMFLLPSINMRLRPKLLQMKPGTRVVSNSFDMEDWQPDDVARIPNCTNWCRALLWIVPARVAGKWKVPHGELTVDQKFQMVSGTLVENGQPLAVEGKLRGNEVTFRAGITQYAGHVDGDRMTVTLVGTTSPWEATRIR